MPPALFRCLFLWVPVVAAALPPTVLRGRVPPAGYAYDLEAAAQLRDVDLVLGSHSHTFLYGAGNASQPGPYLLQGSTARDLPEGPYPTFVRLGRVGEGQHPGGGDRHAKQEHGGAPNLGPGPTSPCRLPHLILKACPSAGRTDCP